LTKKWRFDNKGERFFGWASSIQFFTPIFDIKQFNRDGR